MTATSPISPASVRPVDVVESSARAGRAQTALLWAAFVVVHLWLSWAVQHAPHTPLNDVSSVYRDWVQAGLDGHGWVGIDRPWVYPTLALLPLLAAASLGIVHYAGAWLVLVFVLDVVGLAFLTRGGTRRVALGWWWVVFLLLLGPIAVGRLDSVSVPIALVGLLFVATRPLLGGALLTVGVWIKFWPVAPIIAVLAAGRRRLRVLIGVAATSVVVIAAAIAAGGDLRDVFGFVGQQTGRALQVEAPVSTYWLWLQAAHVPGASTFYDYSILTFEVRGPGAGVAAAVMTPVQALLLLGIVAAGLVARRRGATPTGLLGPLALALTTTLIVGNKVGSPQYEPWLAVCVLVGFVLARRGGPPFTLPGALVLVIALLTQVIYPWNYDALLEAHLWMVVVITARNALLVVLLVVAVRQIVLAGRASSAVRVPSEATAAPAVVAGGGGTLEP